jgi:hypothetical protein
MIVAAPAARALLLLLLLLLLLVLVLVLVLVLDKEATSCSGSPQLSRRLIHRARACVIRCRRAEQGGKEAYQHSTKKREKESTKKLLELSFFSFALSTARAGA